MSIPLQNQKSENPTERVVTYFSISLASYTFFFVKTLETSRILHTCLPCRFAISKASRPAASSTYLLQIILELFASDGPKWRGLFSWLRSPSIIANTALPLQSNMTWCKIQHALPIFPIKLPFAGDLPANHAWINYLTNFFVGETTIQPSQKQLAFSSVPKIPPLIQSIPMIPY